VNFNDPLEENIYHALTSESFTINELSNKLSLSITQLSFKLSMMEIS
jgi:hypothetical protein